MTHLLRWGIPTYGRPLVGAPRIVKPPTPGASDTTPPVTVFISDTRQKVSLVSGFNSTIVDWSVDEACQAFQFREVPSTGSIVTDGTLLVSGGAVPASTTQQTTINGSALTAGDGSKIVKIFAQDLAGNWTT